MTDIKLPPLPDIDRWFPASYAGFVGMRRCADDKPEHVDEYVDINDHIEAMQAYALEAVRMNRCESRASTHAEVCWSWGPAHYECALREIERLRGGGEYTQPAGVPTDEMVAVASAAYDREASFGATHDQAWHVALSEALAAAPRTPSRAEDQGEVQRLREERDELRDDLIETLRDCANALGELLPSDHAYRKIVEQANRLLDRHDQASQVS